MKNLLPLLAVGTLLSSTAVAGTQTADKNPTVAEVPADSGWTFRLAPYAWVTAIDGDVRLGPLSAPVDISMADTLEDLDMAWMGLIEASYGRWSFGLDGVYGKTSQDIPGGGRVFRSFRFEQKQWILTPTISYRVVDTTGYHMDIIAGARFSIFEAELTGRLSGGGQIAASRDADWVDPIIGIRGQKDFNEKWFFRYNGDIGGFGASSDLVWQAFAGVGYNLCDSASIAVGYRGLGLDYEKGGFALDTVSHGPVLGLELRW